MRVNRLDLNRLIALDALLTERNVSRAAERVHLSQPAMSAILAALRDYFGDPLLVPAGRGLQVTPFAASLVDGVREVLLQAHAITQRRPGGDVRSLERTVVVVASEVVASALLARVLRDAPAQAPGLHFDIRAVADHMPEQLERGEVDVVLAPREAMAPGHPSEAVFSTDFVCLVWEGHDRAATGLASEDYASARHVVVRWASGRILTGDNQAAKAAGMQRRIDVSVPSFTLMPQFLEQTQRVATLPRPLAEQLARRWPLRLLPCPLAIPALHGRMQWQRHQSEDPALQWLRERLLQAASELGIAAAAEAAADQARHGGPGGPAAATPSAAGPT